MMYGSIGYVGLMYVPVGWCMGLWGDVWASGVMYG